MTISPSNKIIRISLFAFLLVCELTLPCLTNSYAQTKPTRKVKKVSVKVAKGKVLVLKDTIIIPSRDTVIRLPKSTIYRIELNPEAQSEAFYDSLKVKAYHSRVTKELYNLMVIGKKKEKPERGITIKATAVYEAYKGRHIGKIRLTKVNVLEGEVEDTTIVAETPLAKFANRTHVYTRDRVIYNALLFKKGDVVSPDVIADNERIIRSLGFIHDARIIIVPRRRDRDTVDVVVITQDKFDYQFEAVIISPTNFDLKFKDNSVLGMGNELGFNYFYNNSHLPINGYTVFYSDRNFKRTFVDIKLQYSHYWENGGTELSINKDFITPQTKWGGGLFVGITTQKLGINDYPDTSFTVPYTHNFQDVWLGRSFLQGHLSLRQNLTVAARVYREEYTTRPYVNADSNQYFFNDILMLGGISYKQVYYLRSSMIRAFGITEDVPVGYYIELNSGYVSGEFQNKPYFGLKGGWGRYLAELGYINGVFRIGGFLDNQRIKQGAYDLTVGYYTPLVDMRRWRFRQFVNLRYTAGLNRYKYKYIDLKAQVFGISNILGDQRLSLGFESVFFKPSSYYGFQFALFAYADMALIGTGTSPEQLNTFYSSYGAGIRLRNEGLIIQNLEIKIGYVPKMPNERGRFYYWVSSNDPALFKQLSVSKPDVVPYN